MRTALLAFFLAGSATAQVLEGFEHGNEALYVAANNGADTLNITSVAAHDGAFGAEFTTGTGPTWRLRADVPTAPGNVYDCYVRLRGGVSNNGRSYVGVGAAVGVGTWSAVFAPNTSQIILQNNSGFTAFTNVATAPVSVTPDVWYLMRLDWALNGDMTVELWDESGSSLIASTGTQATSFTNAGGLALRGFTTSGAAFQDVDTFRKAGATPPVVYCTAGTSTAGCAASISASAQPSASGANPCTISIANVEGQRQGLVFYGIDNSGFSPLPWMTGSTSFLCVKPPTQRAVSQNSGGTNGACDGALSLDWNAFQAAFPGALGQPWSVGAKVYAQGWYRDPPAPKTTNLSDAVELTYEP